MDEQLQQQQRQMKKKKKKSKGKIINKKRKTEEENLESNTLFGLILAAICTNANANKHLIKQCLNHLYLSLVSHDLSAPIISLLPVLLKSKCGEIVCRSVEIVGAVSLMSFQLNEMISSECEIVKSLIMLLGSTKRKISMAACNAIMDLSTTAVGQQRLLELSAIDKLILSFVQASKSPAGIVSLYADVIMFKEGGFPIMLLHAAIILINSCTIEQMHNIPTELSDTLLVYLRGLWDEVCKQRILSTSLKCGQEKGFRTSNIKTNNLAESIFRLSITRGHYRVPVDIDNVKRSIFDLGEGSFGHFLSNYWEVSPHLIRDAKKTSTRQDNSFSPFVQFLKSKEAVHSFLPSILKSITSCPPIASDELNILHFVKEVRNHFGSPIIYHQDIRVIKTQSRERELHYFQEKSDSSCLAPHILHIDDILKCEEAYKEGYSIALRGMEFRFQSIAAIADGLASLFGQPSAGVNMYLTPPNSQGLACHSDDHCVFVCQIMGVKRWTIFPRSSLQLPRLYEPMDSWHGLEVENRMLDECKQFLLEEGDILYIPRGFPHEARTIIDDDKFDKTAEFSLHLTLAIEIEPPFAWEGFIQVALCCWDQKQKVFPDTHGHSVSGSLHVVSVNLLHVAIKQFGNLDPAFQKACLVGAISSTSSTEGWLGTCQRTLFWHLISIINTELKFSDALKLLEEAVQKHEDPLEQIRWLKDLILEEEVTKSQRCSISNSDNGCGFHLLRNHRDIAEDVFTEVKSKFCKEIVFEEVEQRYKVMLEKYRKVREQYTDGMLSLHCITGDS
ncbi:uncharacterized protein Fot_57121 [Forsythia ovata]|uniref:Bifunctional lysine-specific demethylase and histidyl-hydroxylase n=1 Tax=Forsythia ovata TaxID=205694 RepID=A0ABD1NWN8_9LAMI